MKWYIGQEIVAIEDHPFKLFKKGDEFILLGIRKSSCCGCIELDIGITTNKSSFICSNCYNLYLGISDNHWFFEKRFAPKETIEDKIELSEALVDINGNILEPKLV